MSTEQNLSGGEGDVLSEALSPAEQAYFSSKGEDLSAFEQEDETPSAPSSAEPQAAPEAAPAVEDDDVYLDENGKPRSVLTGKFVPHGAFHKERERRKQTETELQNTRLEMARASERLAVLNDIIAAGETQAKPQQTVEDDVPPDPEVDIFAHVKWQQRKIAELEQYRAQQAEQQQQARLASEVQNFYRNDAMNFMRETPDFADAYQYVANSFANELRAKGFDDQTIRVQLVNEEASIAYQCKQRGASPAKVIYEMAKARGWQGSNAAAPKPATNAASKLDTIAKGQKSTASLSGAGGGGAEGLTIEALANMSEEEFIAVSAKLGKSKMRQLLGG